MKRRHLIALASTPLLPLLSFAQTGTSRSIHLIVPYVPGGGTDTLARLFAPFIGTAFSQSVVVDNRAGGGSVIGTQAVVKAPPDGLTIGVIDAAFVSNPGLYRNLPYDTLKDLQPVVLLATSPLVLCVHPDVKAANVGELVSLAKARPRTFSFGSAGLGGGSHIAGEQFRMTAGIDIAHIPYKGGGQQIADLIGGQTTMGFFVPSVVKGQVESGKLRAIAVTGARRSALFPTVPTFSESGYPGVDASGMNGIVVPAGTPADYVARLNGAVVRALQAEDVRKRLLDTGFEPGGGTPEEFSSYLRTNISKMSATIRAAGIQPLDQ
jgi:tripartite-type tricarboxylate transporter receptor subunit TctC